MRSTVIYGLITLIAIAVAVALWPEKTWNKYRFRENSIFVRLPGPPHEFFSGEADNTWRIFGARAPSGVTVYIGYHLGTRDSFNWWWNSEPHDRRALLNNYLSSTPNSAGYQPTAYHADKNFTNDSLQLQDLTYDQLDFVAAGSSHGYGAYMLTPRGVIYIAMIAKNKRVSRTAYDKWISSFELRKP